MKHIGSGITIVLLFTLDCLKKGLTLTLFSLYSMKLFTVYINGMMSHCYYSDTKSNIDMSTKIHYCNGAGLGIGQEIKDVLDKVKIVTAIKDFFNKNNVK